MKLAFSRRCGRGGRRLAAGVALALGLAAGALAAFRPPPSPARWVTDGAGFLSDGARRDLDSRLEQYERTSGHQFLVWIAPTAGELSPEDFADQTFQAWRVGRKGIDDGLVLFVFADDKKLRFEVGYGLEAALPDALAGQILSQAIVPRLRAGDRDGGIRAGVEAAIAAIASGVAKGESPAPGASAAMSPGAPAAEDSSPQLSTGQKILFGLLAIGFLILLITHPGFAIWLLFNILSSGRGGGGGGGGFSGGGGRSGGGGASGSW